MGREKTSLRHITDQGSVVRVTKEDDNFFIGNSNDRAEGRMTHYGNISHNNGSSHNSDNPYHGSGSGEWDDYAHTSDDL